MPSNRSPSLVIRHDTKQLADRVVAVGSGLIVLDGCTGAGKTFLARALAKALGCDEISADRYIDRGQDRYVDALRVDDLKSAVSIGFTRSRIVILEGVCARDILERAAAVAALFVYVQRNSRETDLPGDLDILDQEDGHAEHYAARNGLEAEIAAYHQRCKPRLNADIVYIRLE